MPDKNDRTLEKLHHLRKAEESKLTTLQRDASHEADFLKEFVTFFASGGKTDKGDGGMQPDHYLSRRGADLVKDIRESLQSIKHLSEEIERKEGKL